MNPWDAVYTLALPPFLALAKYKTWKHGKYRDSLPGMFGANLPSPPLDQTSHRLWIHAVSVGETIAAASVFRLLKNAHPHWEFLITTITETGQANAKRVMAEANNFDFAPVDFSWKVETFFQACRPTAYLFFETEIWPNKLLACGHHGIPAILVNGKLSDKSARGYAKIKGLLNGPLSCIDGFLMQTPEDAERLRRFAPDQASIQVTGNVKFDHLPEPLSSSERSEIRRAWGIAADETVLLAGSTHDGEEALIANAFKKLRGEKLRLIVAPRHPERFKDAANALTGFGCRVHRLSEGPCDDDKAILLLDQMGVLARSFGAADLALLGGGWNPIGGHNLLEPAAHGIPVIHGPAMHEQKEIMRVVRETQACFEVSKEGLVEGIQSLLDDEKLRREYGKRGQEAALSNRGAAQRSVDLIEEILRKRSPAEPA